MQNIENLLQQLDENWDLGGVRAATAELLLGRLDLMRISLGYWETTHFANAAAAFVQSLHSPHETQAAWIRLCLANLEKVIAPAHQRLDNWMLQDKQLDSLSFWQLRNVIESVYEKGHENGQKQ